MKDALGHGSNAHAQGVNNIGQKIGQTWGTK
jgi:hypothetical protein